MAGSAAFPPAVVVRLNESECIALPAWHRAVHDAFHAVQGPDGSPASRQGRRAAACFVVVLGDPGPEGAFDFVVTAMASALATSRSFTELLVEIEQAAAQVARRDSSTNEVPRG